MDGPELVRHNDVQLSAPVTMVLRQECLELFCDGRCMSFRLPACTDQSRRVGFFVEDGEVDLEGVQVWAGGVFSRTCT